MSSNESTFDMFKSLSKTLGFGPVSPETREKIIKDTIEYTINETGLKDRIDQNGIDLAYETKDSDSLQLVNYSYISKTIKELFGFEEYYTDTCKSGRQHFLYDSKTNSFKKGWRDHSYSRYKNREKNFKTSYFINQFNWCNVVKKHYLSRFMPFRYNHSIFGDFLDKALLLNDINRSRDRISFNWQKNPDIKYLKYIIDKNNVCGFSQEKDSNILIVDIDNDIDNSKFNTFISLINGKMFYAEKSKYSGGWHIYLWYSRNIKDTDRQLLQKFFANKGIKIECCFYNHFIQLPCSIDYSPLDIDKFYQTGELSYYNQFSSYDLKLVLSNTVIRRKDLNYMNDIRVLINFVSNLFKTETNDKPVEEVKADEKPIDPVKVNKWAGIEKYPIYYKAIKTNGIRSDTFIEAKKGNKFIALNHNVKVCIKKGITDYNEIRKILKEYKGTSETISNVPDSDIDQICKYYYKSYEYKNPLYVSDFISNADKLSKPFIKLLKTCKNNFKNEFYKASKLYYKDKTKTKKQDLETIASELLFEIPGSFIYQAKNKKQIIANKIYREKLKDLTFTGITISTSLIDKLLLKLKKDNKITHTFKSKHIKDILFKTLNLKPTFLYQNMNNKVFNKDEYQILDIYLKRLPIQINVGNYESLDELESNLIDLYFNKFSYMGENYFKTLLYKEFKTNYSLYLNHFNNMIYVDSKSSFYQKKINKIDKNSDLIKPPPL